MGEQASLFDFGPQEPPRHEPRHLPERDQRRIGNVRVQLTMLDERADEIRWMAEMYQQLDSGVCPIHILESGEPRRCPLRQCHEHLMWRRNGDTRKTEQQLEAEWYRMPYHCVRDFIRDHPEGATEDEIAKATRWKRQSVQDVLRRALAKPAVRALVRHSQEYGEDP